MPITVCIFQLRNIFHLMLTFLIFHLITYIAVYMQVLDGTEAITLVFIFKLKYFNTLACVSEIIRVEFLYIFMIFMGGWLILSERNVKQKSRYSVRHGFPEKSQGLW